MIRVIFMMFFMAISYRNIIYIYRIEATSEATNERLGFLHGGWPHGDVNTSMAS